MKNTHKNRKIYLIILIILLVALYLIFHKSDKAIPAVLYTVDKGMVESSVANTRAGTVKACRRAKLAPPIGGQVARLLVKEGDKVKKGQLLLEIWNDDLVAQVNLAEKEAIAAGQQAEDYYAALHEYIFVQLR